MGTPDFELEGHLRALFGNLDTRPDFDARLTARLWAESQTDATERAVRARQLERARYRRAVLELQSWRRSMLRRLTLDTLGVALMVVVAAFTAWPHVSRHVMDVLRQYGPYIAMMLGLVVPGVTLLALFSASSARATAGAESAP
jgi:hypothetical protein